MATMLQFGGGGLFATGWWCRPGDGCLEQRSGRVVVQTLSTSDASPARRRFGALCVRMSGQTHTDLKQGSVSARKLAAPGATCWIRRDGGRMRSWVVRRKCIPKKGRLDRHDEETEPSTTIRRRARRGTMARRAIVAGKGFVAPRRIPILCPSKKFVASLEDI